MNFLSTPMGRILANALIWAVVIYWFSPWYHGRRSELTRFSRQWYLIRISQVGFSLLMGTVLFLARKTEIPTYLLAGFIVLLMATAIYHKLKSGSVSSPNPPGA